MNIVAKLVLNIVFIGDDYESDNSVMNSQLLNIKLKLEEKRRQIENDKRKMESIMNRQRQQVGKAAFLQTITRVISRINLI